MESKKKVENKKSTGGKRTTKSSVTPKKNCEESCKTGCKG